MIRFWAKWKNLRFASSCFWNLAGSYLSNIWFQNVDGDVVLCFDSIYDRFKLLMNSFLDSSIWKL